MAAAVAVAPLRGEGREFLARAAGDERRLVRRTALGVLERAGDRAALRTLVERLEFEERPRLRRTLTSTLQRMSGMLA